MGSQQQQQQQRQLQLYIRCAAAAAALFRRAQPVAPQSCAIFSAKPTAAGHTVSRGKLQQGEVGKAATIGSDCPAFAKGQLPRHKVPMLGPELLLLLLLQQQEVTATMSPEAFRAKI